MERLKEWASKVRSETYALYLAYRDPRTPWYAKAFTAVVVGYAFSPIDLVPDFIPVLGYLDDLLLVPVGIWLARKMIPPDVLVECRERAAEEQTLGKPISRVAGAIVVAIWLIVLAMVALIVVRMADRG